MYKCLACNHEDDYQSFVYDYTFDNELDDEVAVLVCPNCGNADEALIVELDEPQETP